MIGNALLLSIHPEYAEKIFDGTKRVELRRVRPRLQNGDLVIVYVSSPVKAVCGAFRVDNVVAGTAPDKLKALPKDKKPDPENNE